MPEQFKVNSSAEESVNLLEKDNDPRKKAYVLKLALESREYWHTLASEKDDDIVTNPNIIDPSITTDEKGNALNALDRRCIQNENNPVYKNFNQAWKTDPRNKTGETAFEMQRRVGHLVEGKLAELADVENPLTLPEVIHKQMQNDILEHWRKNRKEE